MMSKHFFEIFNSKLKHRLSSWSTLHHSFSSSRLLSSNSVTPSTSSSKSENKNLEHHQSHRKEAPTPRSRPQLPLGPSLQDFILSSTQSQSNSLSNSSTQVEQSLIYPQTKPELLFFSNRPEKENLDPVQSPPSAPLPPKPSLSPSSSSFRTKFRGLDPTANAAAQSLLLRHPTFSSSTHFPLSQSNDSQNQTHPRPHPHPSPLPDQTPSSFYTPPPPSSHYQFPGPHSSWGQQRLVLLQTHGCQMNVADTQLVASLLQASGYQITQDPDAIQQCHAVLINTCAIRERAEAKVFDKLRTMRNASKKKQKTGGTGRGTGTGTGTGIVKNQATGSIYGGQEEHLVNTLDARLTDLTNSETFTSHMPAHTSNQLVIGVLGCMAKRMREKLLQEWKLADIVVGPDAYRDLPFLLTAVLDAGPGAWAYNVALSLEETYADVAPMRQRSNLAPDPSKHLASLSSKHEQAKIDTLGEEVPLSAYVSIMRGCANMCAYCIVPYTRGRERSRQVQSILDEVTLLSKQGYKEVVLLGQNVNSYNDVSGGVSDVPVNYASGFSTVYRPPKAGVRFSELLDQICLIDPEMRIRFTSPHPKDFPPEMIDLYRKHNNLCNHVHMPAQSGSSQVLERMNRGYTREAYLDLVAQFRERIPGMAISSDFISGFCGETEADHEQTLDLIRQVGFEQAFMYAFSVREKTFAAKHLQDDVPKDVKSRRLRQVIDTFHEIALVKNQDEIDQTHLVLVEGPSKKDIDGKELCGRSDTNKRVVFPATSLYPSLKETFSYTKSSSPHFPKPGEYVAVKVRSASSLTLVAEPISRTTLQEYFSFYH